MIIVGDCRNVLKEVPDGYCQCVITSPPYWGQRDYGIVGQIGSERCLDEYLYNLSTVFAEVRRILTNDGTFWLNLGDSYAMSTRGSSGKGRQPSNRGSILSDRKWSIPVGLKPKDMCGIPWRVALQAQAAGWY